MRCVGLLDHDHPRQDEEEQTQGVDCQHGALGGQSRAVEEVDRGPHAPCPTRQGDGDSHVQLVEQERDDGGQEKRCERVADDAETLEEGPVGQLESGLR